jgi:hypothetical protein
MVWETTVHELVENSTTDLFGAAIGAYTLTMGFWFYALVMFFTMVLIQIKLNNFGATITTGMIITAAIITLNLLPTETYALIVIMIALGITFILYRVFHK